MDNEYVDAMADLLLARSGGHFEAIRDMSDEKAKGDAGALLNRIRSIDAERIEALSTHDAYGEPVSGGCFVELDAVRKALGIDR
jgi:hypothetical protein